MIVRFSVTNFKSFDEEQTLSMQATGKIKKLAGAVVEVPGHDLLKVAAVYGHNASGKTNLLDAIARMVYFVVESLEAVAPRSIDAFIPFLLSREATERPCEFIFEILLERHVAEYTLHVNRERVTYEQLRVKRTVDTEKATWRRLFERKGRKTSFARTFGSKREQEVLREVTAPQRALLGHAAAQDLPIASDVVRWMIHQARFYQLHRREDLQEDLLHEAAKALEDADFRRRYTELLRDADIGVVAVQPDVAGLRMSPEEAEAFRKEIAERTARGEEMPTVAEEKLRFEPSLAHRADDDLEEVLFPLFRESAGTRRFMAIVYAILVASRDAYPPTLFVDEMDASLSGELVESLVRLVQDERTNPTGMQLIFATHDRSILNNPRLLRTDQVWIAEKKRRGATQLYSMSDFNDASVRTGRPLGRLLASGRLGGVGDLGDSHERLRISETKHRPANWYELAKAEKPPAKTRARRGNSEAAEPAASDGGLP